MDNNSYMNKNDILKVLGFETYTKYLQSSLWKKIRSDVLIKQEYKCCACKNRADQVHHRKYTLQNLSGKNDEFLVAICKGCHYRIEFTKKKKNTLTTANRLLDKKINRKNNKKDKYVKELKCFNHNCCNTSQRGSRLCESCSIKHKENLNQEYKCIYCSNVVDRKNDSCIQCKTKYMASKGLSKLAKNTKRKCLYCNNTTKKGRHVCGNCRDHHLKIKIEKKENRILKLERKITNYDSLIRGMPKW